MIFQFGRTIYHKWPEGCIKFSVITMKCSKIDYTDMLSQTSAEKFKGNILNSNVNGFPCPTVTCELQEIFTDIMTS